MSAYRQIVLTFTRHYLPGYKSGGPTRSIANLVEALGDEFDFRIVTSDRDATDAEPYPGLEAPGEWKSVGKAQVLYLPSGGMGLSRIAGILREVPHDILYLNSFFDPVFTFRPLVARRLWLAPKTRCVIAPRGEFSLGALDIKTWKKRPFLVAAKAAGLYRGLIWQASTVHEEADILRVMRSDASNVHVAIDLPSPSVHNGASNYRPRVDGEPLRVCFLSRISPMKNLHFALKTFKHVQSTVSFDVFGPVRDEEYWNSCRDIMGQLPPHVNATYRGGVDHAAVSSTFEGYDLFFLPTHGENYGHVILEALSAGTPVLIADTTPWRNLAASGVGWDLPLDDIVAFAEKIDLMAQMDAGEQIEMRSRARAFAWNCHADASIVEDNRNLFRAAFA